MQYLCSLGCFISTFWYLWLFHFQVNDWNFHQTLIISWILIFMWIWIPWIFWVDRNYWCDVHISRMRFFPLGLEIWNWVLVEQLKLVKDLLGRCTINLKIRTFKEKAKCTTLIDNYVLSKFKCYIKNVFFFKLMNMMMTNRMVSTNVVHIAWLFKK